MSKSYNIYDHLTGHSKNDPNNTYFFDVLINYNL